MEKLIYTFRDSNSSSADLKQRMLKQLGPQLKSQSGVHQLQINIADEHVAEPLRPAQFCLGPALAGTLSVWVDSSYYRSALEALLSEQLEVFHGYAVVESQPIVNSLYPPEPGERTAGFSQIVFIEKPQRLDYDQWLDLWLNSHTRAAIDTQSNFQYVQNIVQRSLTEGAPVCHAIIEECFPMAALKDPYVFFNAEGDEKKFQANVQAMTESCDRFIDQHRLDVFYTSQYVL